MINITHGHMVHERYVTRLRALAEQRQQRLAAPLRRWPTPLRLNGPSRRSPTVYYVGSTCMRKSYEEGLDQVFNALDKSGGSCKCWPEFL